MLALLNYRLKITVQDGRVLIGQMLAFDKHMNLVLSECEEFRRVKSKGKSTGQPEREEKRALGLVILRGETVVSISIESPPPVTEPVKAKTAAASIAGPGIGRPAGRGLPVPPAGMPAPGLAGPVRGVGGPAPGMMAPPMAYGRPPVPGFTAGGPPPQMGYGRGAPPPMPGFGRGAPPMMPGIYNFYLFFIFFFFRLRFYLFLLYSH